MKQIQQQYEIMSNRVNTLMELLQHLQQSIELHNYSMIEQTIEEPRDATVTKIGQPVTGWSG
jgi:hypothetical protein